MPLTDQELYEELSKEKIERYNQEVRQTYNPEMVDRVDQKVRNLTKPQWEHIKEEGGSIAHHLAMLMDYRPSDPEVQTWIAKQHAWIENFYPASADVFRGLGELYASNTEFRAFYDQHKPGLADFMQQAISYYADTVLTK